MTENQFIENLKYALNQLPAEERNDILQDIREYFTSGRADGKPEAEIAAELGNPAAIAKELVDSFDFSKTEVPAMDFALEKDEFDAVEIETENADLEISPSNDGRMYVDISNKSHKQELNVKVIKRKLVISLTEESLFWGIFSTARSRNTSVLSVRLPDKLYERVRIIADHGSITGKQLSASHFQIETENGRIDFSRVGAGSFTAYSDNGDITLNAAQAKTVKIETENGKLHLTDIQSDKVEAASDNGAIIMKDVEADVHAETDNGRIHLTADSLDRKIALETDNGAILVEARKAPENSTIRAEVDLGSISVFGSSRETTVYGSGRNEVNLFSDNGSITVKLIGS